MKIGSLFAGIGGLELGLERAGLGHVAWQVEKDNFCLAVLKKHWPHVRKHDDVKTVGAGNLEPVDLLCGGFPCQDVSGAGKGRGIEVGTRSGLWIEFDRIVGELRPTWIVVENVASGQAKWVSRVQHDLRARGYDTRAYALSAADVGAPHLRRRIFVVAHADAHRREANGVEPEGGRIVPTLADADHVGRQALDVEPARDASGGLTDRSGGAEALADADRSGVRQRAEWIATRWPDDIREPEGSEPEHTRAPVADDHSERLESRATSGLHADGAPGGDTARCDGWPPRRGEATGWGVWAGPQPGIRRAVDGVPTGLYAVAARDARRAAKLIDDENRDRLRALGNAVVPQCAEVIGRIIAEMVASAAERNPTGPR